MTESDFSHYFFNQLKNIIPKEYESLEIGEGVNLLTDMTCLIVDPQKSKRYKLVLGLSENDVVIYKSILLDKSNLKGLPIILSNDSTKNKTHLKIPFVIIELKSGALGTDSIRNKSMVAYRIKQVFPFSAYYFIAQNTKKMDETLLRQGKDFTNYFIKSTDFNEEDIQKIFAKFIKPHLDNLRERGFLDAS